jgi:hypothetical protein
VALLYPRALGSPLLASYDSQGYDGVILTRLNTEYELQVKVKVTLRPAVSRSVRLGVSTHLGPLTNFSPSLFGHV